MWTNKQITIADAPHPLVALLTQHKSKPGEYVSEDSLTSFSELDTGSQERYRRYVKGVIASESERLSELAEFELPEWDNNTFHAACNIFEMAKAPWSPLSSQEAEQIIRDSAPPFDDEGWSEPRLNRLIDSAYSRVFSNDHVRPYPEIKETKPTTPKVPDAIAQLEIAWYSDIEDRDYEWYEPNWIPKTGCVLVAGYGGSGKSTLFAYWISLVTKGLWGGRPQKCIYLTKEDDESAIVKPRLSTAGADLSKVATVFVKEPDFNGEMKERSLNFRKNLDALRVVVRAQEIKVIFLDPGVSFLGIDEDRDSKDMQRTVLEDLHQFAKDEQILIFVIKHYKKVQTGSEKMSARDKLYGSTVWFEVFRHVLGLRKIDQDLKEKLGLEEDDPLSAILHIDKNSYGPDDLPLKAFRLEETRYRNNPISRLVPDGERKISTRDIDARESETEEQADRRIDSVNKSDKWILEVLRSNDGVVSRSRVEELCESQKGAPSFRTVLRRVNKMVELGSLEIEKRKGDRNNVVLWHLSNDQGPSDPMDDLAT